MSQELNYFPIAIPYYRDFVQANYRDFRDHMREYRTYPSGGYSSFYRDNEVMQVLINICGNLEETFVNLEIPEDFPSPKALVRAWKNFLKYLKKEDALFDDVYKKLGGGDDNFPYSPILTTIDTDRQKIIYLLEHILSLDEVKKYIDDELIKKLDEENAKLAERSEIHVNVFDIVIITAIYKEYEQVVKLLDNGVIPSFKDPSRTIYFQGELTTNKGGIVKVLVTCANQMGMTSAASLASKLIYRFAPKLVAMVGIAAGISGEIGDVMIPDILWDYGSGKSTLEPKRFLGRKIFGISRGEEEVFTPYRFPITIKQNMIAQLIRLMRETDISQRIAELGKGIEFQQKAKKIKVHIGPFVSGSAVIANDKILAQIKAQDGKLVGFDMEAFAIAYACSVADVTPQPISLIMKSISDYGNKKKSHAEKDNHQEYAAFTSANLLVLLIIEHSDALSL